ncbi:hypothetical protein KM043_011636 [Ampulex compressa]|nr:hypothetical protein KM043_011636 [Ampulex compressa]
MKVICYAGALDEGWLERGKVLQGGGGGGRRTAARSPSVELGIGKKEGTPKANRERGRSCGGPSVRPRPEEWQKCCLADGRERRGTAEIQAAAKFND